jgi:16S rRNA (cytosine967-C5)-methyltransferase
MIAPARRAAYLALRAITEGRQDLPSALASGRKGLDDERDRALALEIVTGSLRWQRRLDHLIGHVAKRPLDRIDADVLSILRLSAYQLFHLDRVPVAAVVDDAVGLARAARRSHAAGFVNALLRTLLRSRHRLPLPARPSAGARREEMVAYLGITHSHPEWLVDRWLQVVGFEAAERWVQFNNTAPRLTLRVNAFRTCRNDLMAALHDQDVETQPTRYAPLGLNVVRGNPLRRSTDGSFVVQDEASQLVGVVTGAHPGERVLDVCAAPGGKTTAMAADMADRGILVATDVRARRVRLLHDTVRLSGAHCIRIVQIEPAAPLPFSPSFDRVLVDAPCSGLGTIRRDPDIRWRRRPEDLAALAARQRDLLHRSAAVVAPGGHLVYATCSSEPEENEQVVDAFLGGRDDFAVVDLRAAPQLAPSLRSLLDDRGMFRTRPYAHDLEAFFVAVLQRL